MNDDLPIPDFLIIDPETRKKAWNNVKLTRPRVAPVDNNAVKAQLKAHKLKKLRAEERRLSKLIDELGNRDNNARRKLYAAIHHVEKQISQLKEG